MLDHKIPKPGTISGYALHRMVAGLVDGSPALFLDNGDHLVIRTAKPITATGRAVEMPPSGAVIAFELKASVAARKGGKNIYPPQHDWRVRREWLNGEGFKHGFEVLAVHVSANRECVATGGGRSFWIDASQFTGVLKVIDALKFSVALGKGVGRVGKAYGMGMLLI